MTNSKNSNRLRKDEGTREKRNAHPLNLDDTTKPSVSSQEPLGNKEEPDEFERWLDNRMDCLNKEISDAFHNEETPDELTTTVLSAIGQTKDAYRSLKPQLLNSACRHLSKRICDLSKENEKYKKRINDLEGIMCSSITLDGKIREQILNDLLNDEKAKTEAGKTFAKIHYFCKGDEMWKAHVYAEGKRTLAIAAKILVEAHLKKEGIE